MVPNNYSTIKLAKKQCITWIILDRPNKFNAINSVMLQELSVALDFLEKDIDTKCVVISGAGEKAFSSGADLIELQNLSPHDVACFSVKGQRVFSKIEKMTKPVIASVNGYALGGGLELALACDFRFASDSAQFGFPELKLGLIPAWGGTQRLPLIVGVSKAKQLMMLGEQVNVVDAQKMGLVDKLFSVGELSLKVELFAQGLCDFYSHAHCCVKKNINYGNDSLFELGLKKETDCFVRLFSSRATKKKLSDAVSRLHKK